MPIGFPSSPADNDPYPSTGTPIWRYSTTKGAWLPIADAVTARITSLVGTDDFLALRTISGTVTPHLVAASVIDSYVGGGPSIPAAFTVGQWTLTPGNGQVTIDITALPSDGGSAITALQYRIDGGSAVTLSGTGTGARVVTGLTNGTEYDFELRAVNAVDANPTNWGDLKSATPTVGSTTYLNFATLSGMSETANGGGFDYAGTAGDGTARGSDYVIADESNGGFKVQIPTPTGGAIPIAGLYLSDGSTWDGSVFALAYPQGGVGSEWECTRGATESYQDLTGGAVVTYAAGDWIRFRVTDEDVVVDVARSGTPDTWIPLGSATIAHSGDLYPRQTSFGAAGGSFVLPQVV